MYLRRQFVSAVGVNMLQQLSIRCKRTSKLFVLKYPLESKFSAVVKRESFQYFAPLTTRTNDICAKVDKLILHDGIFSRTPQ